MRLVWHANELQEMSNVAETDVGSELPVTSFDDTHPSLAKLIWSNK